MSENVRAEAEKALAMVDEVNEEIIKELNASTVATYYSVDEIDATTPANKHCGPSIF